MYIKDILIKVSYCAQCLTYIKQHWGSKQIIRIHHYFFCLLIPYVILDQIPQQNIPTVEFLKKIRAVKVALFILYLHYEERRDIQWNIAWAQGKFWGRSTRDFQRARANFHRRSWLESKYRHYQFLKMIHTVLSSLVGYYWKSGFSVLIWQLGLYFPVYAQLSWANTETYSPLQQAILKS